MKRGGLVRVEVQVPKTDADLVRKVAGALRDPERDAEARAFLRAKLGNPQAQGLKALLAAAPLEGIEFDRPRDLGRNVKL